MACSFDSPYALDDLISLMFPGMGLDQHPAIGAIAASAPADIQSVETVAASGLPIFKGSCYLV